MQALRDSNLQPSLANFPWTEPSSRIHHLFNSATSSIFRVLGGVYKLHLRIVSLVASFRSLLGSSPNSFATDMGEI